MPLEVMPLASLQLKVPHRQAVGSGLLVIFRMPYLKEVFSSGEKKTSGLSNVRVNPGRAGKIRCPPCNKTAGNISGRDADVFAR